MARLLIYLILIGLAAYCLYRFWKPPANIPRRIWSSKFGKRPFRENWVQVYETASWEEAQQIQARLQEEGVECILYEQGKKDIHGNPPRGIGIAVPKATVGLAQKVISRIPV